MVNIKYLMNVNYEILYIYIYISCLHSPVVEEVKIKWQWQWDNTKPFRLAKLKKFHDTNKMATNICVHTMSVGVLIFLGTRFPGQVAVSKECNDGNSSSSISYNNDNNYCYYYEHTCDSAILVIYFQEMIIQHHYCSSNSNNNKYHYYIGSTY